MLWWQGRSNLLVHIIDHEYMKWMLLLVVTKGEALDQRSPTQIGWGPPSFQIKATSVFSVPYQIIWILYNSTVPTNLFFSLILKWLTFRLAKYVNNWKDKSKNKWLPIFKLLLTSSNGPDVGDSRAKSGPPARSLRPLHY